MNDIESIRDYKIADEIARIQTLSEEDVKRELIEQKAKEISAMSTHELIDKHE